MTVIATRPRSVTTRAADLPQPTRRRTRLRRIVREILRYAIATVVVVVLGQLMTPAEARAAVRADLSAY